jgi:hypothetical protein
MGYTHYWYSFTLPADVWAQISRDCDVICRGLGRVGLSIELAGVRCDDELVTFGGVGERSCETFRLCRDARKYRGVGKDDDGRTFSFCKTRAYPYDVAVTACLIAAKHAAGNDIHVSSDGGDEDWARARQVCQKLLGYGDQYHIDGDRGLVDTTPKKPSAHPITLATSRVLSEFLGSNADAAKHLTRDAVIELGRLIDERVREEFVQPAGPTRSDSPHYVRAKAVVDRVEEGYPGLFQVEDGARMTLIEQFADALAACARKGL